MTQPFEAEGELPLDSCEPVNAKAVALPRVPFLYGVLQGVLEKPSYPPTYEELRLAKEYADRIASVNFVRDVNTLFLGDPFSAQAVQEFSRTTRQGDVPQE